MALDTFSAADIELLREQLLIRTIRSTFSQVGRNATHTIDKECMHWLMTDSNQPFSYLNCCRSMGIDSTVLRGLILHYYRSHIR